MNRRPVLIDTDTGVDDAMALILALRSPEISVKAITTVAGNVEVHKCTRNVLALLDRLNPAEYPRVAQGASRPLRRSLLTAPEVHGRDGMGNVLKTLVPQSRAEQGHAIDLILEMCKRYGRRLTIVAIGPLTNLALSLRKNPSVFRRAGRIVSMGGAVRVPGNTGPVAEFNYYVDPDAAHAVLNAGIPLTMIPLDLTEQLSVTRREAEAAARNGSPMAAFVLRFTDHYMKYHRIHNGFYGGFLHDPVAVAAAVKPSLLATRRVHVDVETESGLTRGMTVADLRLKPGRSATTVDLAVGIKAKQFLSLFHRRLWR